VTAGHRPFAITLDVGSSLANRTGSWRVERPVYVDLQPPCNRACPAGEDIQQWLYDAEDGSYEKAWRTLVADNPFPAVMGRVCYHPCQTSCNRALVDEAVGINSVERFLGDLALKEGWALPVTAPPSGRRVLIIGAGPSGLSAAYHLRRLGHEVTVRDAGKVAGGMLYAGIPAYRLPRDVLAGEIARIVDLGVTIELGHTATDVLAEMTDGGFDAAFLAVGAHVSKRAYIPAGEAARILHALDVLKAVHHGEPPLLGRRVAVYGGGNTALDTARTAKRLGAEEAVVVYRRTRDKMPAHDSELQEAMEEGVQLRWLSTITHAAEGAVTIEKMELDENGWPQPTGETEQLEADSLVLALGHDVDLSLLQAVPDLAVVDGVVAVDEAMMTSHPGIFAGGDMVPSERTVTVAVGHGKHAARNVDAWLRGLDAHQPSAPAPVEFEALNTWYYADAPQAVRPKLEAARRTSTFDEVVHGLDESTALYEARRCMSCGNCFECDNCYGVCPDNAVLKLAPGSPEGHGPSGRLAFDLDYCKGCGVCVSECPAGAIVMVPEPE
jgi:NADPH-dependent glutamate synthase beta subunit-like oxidoreductase